MGGKEQSSEEPRIAGFTFEVFSASARNKLPGRSNDLEERENLRLHYMNDPQLWKKPGVSHTAAARITLSTVDIGGYSRIDTKIAQIEYT